MAQFLSVFKNICNFVGVILEREYDWDLLILLDIPSLVADDLEKKYLPDN